MRSRKSSWRPADPMDALADWKSFPRDPGVYLMHDAKGRVLYVGKAKDLRARLYNYTQPGGDGRPQIPMLLRKVATVRCIVTSSEKEALLLENTLIKKHRPPFNIELRDDKEYLLLRVDLAETYPRFELVRRVSKGDGAIYFGPFSSARDIRETLRTVHRMFQLCSCSRSRFGTRKRPCLNYQMGRCQGACAGLVVPEDYLIVVRNAIRFMRGDYKDLLKNWKSQMTALATEMRFEEAAVLRDRIELIARTMVRQRVVRTVPGDVDAVGWHREGEVVTTAILHLRDGRLSDAHTFHFDAEVADAEALSSFLLQHYAEDAFLPGELLLPFDSGDCDPLGSVLSDRAGHGVTVHVPKKGERARLIDLANRNAGESHRMRKEKEASYDRIASKLSDMCGLPHPPMRIEGFDISNISGTEAVGSMVTFVGGKAIKKYYRKFTVRGIEGQNDFAMMQQVVRRRFAHDEDFGGMPDLLLIDGGKGQLGAALQAMKEAGFGSVAAISLAKERTREGETVFSERIFLPGRKNPVIPQKNDPVLLLLMRIRDEAHRFAVSFHRARRSKQAFAGR
ncbi:MAG TPA: excinuclease ABC subunit UvrC [Candidatus Deferrimicrobiaceae bacterium]